MDTAGARYVTIDDLRKGADGGYLVFDAVTGRDITRHLIARAVGRPRPQSISALGDMWPS
jgi:polyhydroxyalkanoate synthesis regulator protein